MSGRLDQPYYHNEHAGVAVLASSGIVTAMAILYIIVFRQLDTMRKYNKTHIFSHFLILLFANILQAIGTMMNFKWVTLKEVQVGTFCTVQAGIKQAANISTALFTFTISLHLFGLLFLRVTPNTLVFSLALLLSWLIVLLIVVVGPTVIETAERGPYFGPSGAWCWITDEYPKQRILLEYFLEYLFAFFSFILYSVILLRVRGNLYRKDHRWHLRNLNKEEAWQLSIGRDIIDNNTLKVARSMVWYPVAYTLILVPISAARIPEFAGWKVPLPVTILSSIIFNMTGFVNAILLLKTRKYFPSQDAIPTFSTKRKHVSVALHKTGGLIPFTVDRSEKAEEYDKVQKERHHHRHHQRSNSCSTCASGVTRSDSCSTCSTSRTRPEPSRSDSYDSMHSYSSQTTVPRRAVVRVANHKHDNSQTSLLL